MILFHRIKFECVLAIYHVGNFSVVISSRVDKSSLVKWSMLFEYGWLPMVIRGEYRSESISHFYLAIKGGAEAFCCI